MDHSTQNKSGGAEDQLPKTSQIWPKVCLHCFEDEVILAPGPIPPFTGYFFIPFTFRDCLDSLKVFLFAARVSTNSKQDREKCAL